MTRARAILVAAALCGVATGACRRRDKIAKHDPHAAPGEDKGGTILYPTAPGSFVDVVADARNAVVAIRAGKPVKSGPAAMFPGAPEATADVALGSGFLIEHNGQYVLTSDAIATAADGLEVVLPDGRTAPAKFLGGDDRLHVALLSVELPRVRALRLGDSDRLKVGEWTVVLGNPFGTEVTASVGILSATGRDAAASLVGGKAMGFRTFLQLDARVHRGNAGGPVLDTAGQVVGVAVATGDRPGELAFAVPINRVREVLEPLRDHGMVVRSWLGVMVKPVTAEVAAQLALPQPGGALVTEVKAGSPAARAGLRAGDVIQTWGDASVDDRSLPHLVAATPPARTIQVTTWRSGAAITIPVVTDRMPE